MSGNRPKAVLWYEVYCHLFGLLNLFTAWEGFRITRDPYGVIAQVRFLQDQAVDQATTDAVVFLVSAMGWTFVAVGLVFGIAAFTLPRTPDGPKTYVAHLVHLVFGMTSGILLPLCLPVFLGYLKSEVKSYYGVANTNDKA